MLRLKNGKNAIFSVQKTAKTLLIPPVTRKLVHIFCATWSDFFKNTNPLLHENFPPPQFTLLHKNLLPPNSPCCTKICSLPIHPVTQKFAPPPIHPVAQKFAPP